MLVKLIINKAEEISNQWLKDNLSGLIDNLEGLTLNKHYTVYGLRLGTVPLVSIIESPDDDYPLSYPLECFEIVDNRLSKFFVCGMDETTYGIMPFISFEEMVNDRSFWYKLVDNKKSKISIFREYQRALDLEFYNPDMVTNDREFTLLSGNWFTCPGCEKVLELKDAGEMAECIYCNNIFKINKSTSMH